MVGEWEPELCYGSTFALKAISARPRWKSKTTVRSPRFTQLSCWTHALAARSLEYTRPHLPKTLRGTVGRREREEKKEDTWCVLKLPGRWLFILQGELLLVRKKWSLCGADYFSSYKTGWSLNLCGAEGISGYKSGTLLFLLKTRSTSY